ncbi:IPT/TIG domain-containing protein [Adhaeribacter aerolatus]|nr:IPT/TIG domain-containing protein [Adhaeribacter aerolatus]
MQACGFIICYLALLTGIAACDPAKETPDPNNILTSGTAEIYLTPAEGNVNTFVKITGTGFGNNRKDVTVKFNNVPALVKEVADKTILTVVPVTATTGKVSVTINDYTVYSAGNFTVLTKNISAFTGTWVRKADFLGINRSGVSAFANATTGFVTLGGAGDFVYKDTWQYQPARDIWDVQSAFPGIPRFSAVSFTIDKKAYVVTGFAYFKPGKINDFWEFDTETFVWTKKADFPGTERKVAVAFTINNKGYVTTGYTDYFAPELKDMWEYDPVADKWQQKADIPFVSRKGAAGFSMGGKGYVGMGTHINNDGSEDGLNDFWEYEPATDKWARKADFPEYITLVSTSFVLDQSGYLINGDKECWQYNPAANKWTEKKPLPIKSGGLASFVIQNKAYVLEPYIGHLYQFEP